MKTVGRARRRHNSHNIFCKTIWYLQIPELKLTVTSKLSALQAKPSASAKPAAAGVDGATDAVVGGPRITSLSKSNRKKHTSER